jgi:hypothetical protein
MTIDQNVVSVKAELDALTEAFFRAVSFEAGEKPSYQTLYTLFIGRGLLIKNTSTTPEISTVSEFIAPRQQLVDSGELKSFRESETVEITEIFGNIAHRFCTYEKQGVNRAGTFEGRGIISIQFIMTADGWKMSAMAWDDERDTLTIPERYK